jgi:hypothetical protein
MASNMDGANIEGIMSDKVISAVKQYLYKTGPNGINTNSVDTMFEIDLARGKKAKKVLDSARSSQNYYKTKDVHKELLNHYENVDWYERNTQFDFEPFVDRS